MALPRTVLVVNPASKKGALGRQWSDIAAAIRRDYGPFEDVRTEAEGDGTRVTREVLRSGAERVVAVGGDGTISEVAAGFFDGGAPIAPEAELGVLPFGTGGDFRKTLAMPKDLPTACRALARGQTRRIDVGRLSYTAKDGSGAERMFVNIASFGISGLVDELVNAGSKRLGGRLSFLIGTARATVGYTNQRVRLVFDGDDASPIDMTINTVAVANGRYFGGGMLIAPEAELDDGAFDVVALGDMTLGDFLRSGHRIYGGSHLELDKVSWRRARTLRAEPLDPDPVRLDVDGETPGILPATFELVPAALELVVP